MLEAAESAIKVAETPDVREPLNDRQERFCLEFVVSENATRAYLRVYTTSSYAAAGVSAHDLLRNPKILARIDELKAERARRLGISADRILAGVAAVAHFDPRDLFDADGRYKPITELDPDTALAVAAMGTRHTITGDEKDEVAVFTTVRFGDRLRALELLGKHEKLWTDKIEIAEDVSYTERLKLLREQMKEERLRDRKA